MRVRVTLTNATCVVTDLIPRATYVNVKYVLVINLN